MNKHKKILLCDANFCVLPILKTIKSYHHSLSVVGSKLDDPAHAIADASIPINYADTKLLYEHIMENNYDGIVPGCNDRSYLSLSSIAEKMKFPGFDSYETVLTIHHKDKFRIFAEVKNYPIPKAITSIKQLHTLTFPILIKPIDSFSGKGIYKAYSVDEVANFWQKAQEYSPSGSVVAEEFVEGKLYSHSVFIKNGKIIVDFFVNEYCTVYPYQVNSSHIATLLEKKIKEGLRQWTETFAKDLNLCDGLIHTQFISDNETFSLIEIARRCPGDLYSQLIQHSTGVDYAALYTMPFCGLELPDDIEKTENRYMARHTVSVNNECVYIGSTLNLTNVKVQNIQLKYSGEKMRSAPYDKSGIYFIEFESADAMESNTEQIRDFVQVETLTITNKDAKNGTL